MFGKRRKLKKNAAYRPSNIAIHVALCALCNSFFLFKAQHIVGQGIFFRVRQHTFDLFELRAHHPPFIAFYQRLDFPFKELRAFPCPNRPDLFPQVIWRRILLSGLWHMPHLSDVNTAEPSTSAAFTTGANANTRTVTGNTDFICFPPLRVASNTVEGLFDFQLKPRLFQPNQCLDRDRLPLRLRY